MQDFFMRGTTNREICATFTISQSAPSVANQTDQTLADLTAESGFFGVASPTLDSSGTFEAKTPDGIKISIVL